MARLEQALQLRSLSRQLSNGSHSSQLQHRCFSALRHLRAGRPLLVKVLHLANVLGISLSNLHPKLRLWGMACGDSRSISHDNASALQALQETHAWEQAEKQQNKIETQKKLHRWNHRGRLISVEKVIATLENEPNKPVFFWHHHDTRGVLTRSWLSVLRALREKGWRVIVSSSTLSPTTLRELENAQITISKRENIGLCLGAYKDFCCLIQENRPWVETIPTLVLANDSTLPIRGSLSFIDVLETMRKRQNESEAQLSGLTDSVERGFYHLQSYLLMGNSALLTHKAWKHFWRQLDVKGSKDDLINNGEIGLSQTLLKEDVTLHAHFSLVKMLLNESSTATELATYNKWRLLDVNLSLYAWQALLNQGCPLLKKQVLFNSDEHQNISMPMGRIESELGSSDDDLCSDLEELLRSRHLDA